jgi:hypothetical protein
MYQLDEHKLAKHHQTYVYCDTHKSAKYPAPIDQLLERDPAEHQSTMYQLDEHKVAEL